ncbi:MAG TPA: 3-isopropylmalate dehydratase small subunit [Verrucomicrobiae bacterium]|nr:3-isopropylmalate dehydratase small subunit [Verrucomicrobiae bacterium]
MPLTKITSISGRCVPVPGDDIDTDRIIPARFMKCVTFDGLGQYMFYDVRHDEKGQPRQHPLNDPRFAGAAIILSGKNFGCGSSREHAPQAIRRAGFKAVVAEGFAEIFFGNSTTLGMPCVSASRADIGAISEMVEANPALELTLDLAAKTLSVADRQFPFDIRETARAALMAGEWDPIAQLLDSTREVDRVATALPYVGPRT